MRALAELDGRLAEALPVRLLIPAVGLVLALGLLMAQDPELLILDDFSLGLDPGYRRLFVEYLRDFCKQGEKTVFLTSHIIQDLERLVDDCIIMDYGKILKQCPVGELITPEKTLEDTFIDLTGKY